MRMMPQKLGEANVDQLLQELGEASIDLNGEVCRYYVEQNDKEELTLMSMTSQGLLIG